MIIIIILVEALRASMDDQPVKKSRDEDKSMVDRYSILGCDDLLNSYRLMLLKKKIWACGRDNMGS